jgi:hypothetical protein
MNERIDKARQELPQVRQRLIYCKRNGRTAEFAEKVRALIDFYRDRRPRAISKTGFKMAEKIRQFSQ